MKKHAEANPERCHPGTAHMQRELGLYLRIKEAGLQAKAEVTAEGRAIGGEREIGHRLPRCLTRTETHTVSTTRYSDSESEQRRSQTRSRSPDRGSSRHKYSAKTEKVVYQQGQDLRE